jgi:hypothetical protein
MSQAGLPTTPSHLLEYDAVRRRLWILGQRCHHGATGTLLAAGALLASSRGSVNPRAGMLAAATGTLLMAHDWKDRSIWFEPGHGSQT